jgi:hypothetical protein
MALGVKDEGTGIKIVKRKVRSSGRTAGQGRDGSEVKGYTTRMRAGLIEVPEHHG